MSEAKKTIPPSRGAAPKPSPTHPALRALGRLLLWFTGLLAAGTASVLLLLALALAMAYPNLPDISGLTDYRPKLPLRVLSREGLLLAEPDQARWARRRR
ncbi:hypothetical protein ACVBEH_24195 [Roseateles sp. GG27B]